MFENDKILNVSHDQENNQVKLCKDVTIKNSQNQKENAVENNAIERGGVGG